MKMTNKFYTIEVSEEGVVTILFDMNEVNPLTEEKLKLIIGCFQSCQEYLYD